MWWETFLSGAQRILDEECQEPIPFLFLLTGDGVKITGLDGYIPKSQWPEMFRLLAVELKAMAAAFVVSAWQYKPEPGEEIIAPRDHPNARSMAVFVVIDPEQGVRRYVAKYEVTDDGVVANADRFEEVEGVVSDDRILGPLIRELIPW